MSLAIIIGSEVPEIAGMALLGFRQAVLMILRVVMSTRAHRVGSRTISVLVDMKGVLLTGSKSLEVGRDLYAVRALHEADHTFSVLPGGGVKHGNGEFGGRLVSGA